MQGAQVPYAVILLGRFFLPLKPRFLQYVGVYEAAYRIATTKLFLSIPGSRPLVLCSNPVGIMIVLASLRDPLHDQQVMQI